MTRCQPPSNVSISTTPGASWEVGMREGVASGAAALGRAVTLFATNDGCRALLDDWSTLDEPGRDAMVRARGVAGIGELRDAAKELGVRLIACEAGTRTMLLDVHDLTAGVEVAGIASFLEATRGGQIISL